VHPEFRDATLGFDILQLVQVFPRRHKEQSDVTMFRRFERGKLRGVFDLSTWLAP